VPREVDSPQARAEAVRPRPVVRLRVLVSGRVQGVFFRETCRRTALELGVAGSVRNLADGRVEAVFEGPEEAVFAMVSWCRTGPPRARVDDVEVLREEPQGEAGFVVR
jgi:acylphosphatase